MGIPPKPTLAIGSVPVAPFVSWPHGLSLASKSWGLGLAVREPMVRVARADDTRLHRLEPCP